MSGTTGTVLTADVSKVSDSVAGDTCSTVTPVGTTTSSGSRWNSRRPGRAPSEVDHGDQIGAAQLAERAAGAAQAHVDEAGRLAEQLELIGNVAVLERHAQRALRLALPGHQSPEQRRQRDREHLQPEVPEDPDAHRHSAARRGRDGAFREAARPEQLAQPDAQVLGREVALDAAVEDERDPAGLLGDDDGDARRSPR